ncbi:MAG: hypothetical protein OXR73_12085 [Myxococcales bacterium]|nr:hypothetical protein [Myxococcales bacterium]
MTPYRRVCGTLALLMVSVLAPNLGFAIAVAKSWEAVEASRWMLLAALAGVVLLPPVRRVSERTSWVVLISTCLCVTVVYSNDLEIKKSVAEAAGMFDDLAPWNGAPVPPSARTIAHPDDGYTLRVSDSWVQAPGPIENVTRLTLRRDGALVAVLRPSCAILEIPLAVRVLDLEKANGFRRVACSRWHGLDTCLLARPAPDGKGTEWDWYAGGPVQYMHLQLLLYSSEAKQDVYAILNSARPAPSTFHGPGCLAPATLPWP